MGIVLLVLSVPIVLFAAALIFYPTACENQNYTCATADEPIAAMFTFVVGLIARALAAVALWMVLSGRKGQSPPAQPPT